MKTTQCSHPNCKLSATKKHPKVDRGLCEQHYCEIINIKNTVLITLTCSDIIEK